MLQIRKYLIYISVLVIILQVNKVYSLNSSDIKYIKNELILNLDPTFFDFPLEVYGVHLIYPQNIDTVIIKSFQCLGFWHNTINIWEEKSILYSEFKNNHSDIFNKIKFNPPKAIQNLFRKYGVYFIRRAIKTFSPSDTIPKLRINRIGKKYERKSPNYNKSLYIFFSDKYDAKKIKDEFKSLSFVKSVELNEIVQCDESESPVLIEKGIPDLPDSLKKNVIGKSVVVTITVDKYGSIKETQIFKSSNSLLDSISLDAAYKCRFKPGKINGEPRLMKTNVIYRY